MCPVCLIKRRERGYKEVGRTVEHSDLCYYAIVGVVVKIGCIGSGIFISSDSLVYFNFVFKL